MQCFHAVRIPEVQKNVEERIRAQCLSSTLRLGTNKMPPALSDKLTCDLTTRGLSHTEQPSAHGGVQGSSRCSKTDTVAKIASVHVPRKLGRHRGKIVLAS